MITKGIILEKSLVSNTFKVRIPYCEQAGFLNKEFYEAIVSHEPALIDSYNVGDVVLLGFEDHNGDKPIILGKLLLKDNDSRGSANLSTLNVSTNATLPESTTIGGIDIYELLNKLSRKVEILQQRLDSMKIEQ